jgi:hypothetical protein
VVIRTINKYKKGEKMKKIMGITGVILSMIIIVVFGSSCVGQNIAERITEGVIEKAIEGESGGNVEIDLSEGEEGEIRISSEDSEITLGTGAELPEGFPEDVPIYGDMEITTSFTSSEDDKNIYSITAVSPKSVEEIFDWYINELSGWSIENEYKLDADNGENSGKNYNLIAQMDGITLTLGLSGHDEETGILLAVGVAK